MSCTAGILTQMIPELENQLKPQLTGLFGGVIRGYLPQTWTFQTEQGIATLRVDRSGTVTAAEGPDPSPDVTIEIGHDRLRAALLTRDRTRVPPGPIQVTPHTSRGKTAFDFLRSRIGL